MRDVLVQQYTDGEFRALLSEFQDAVDKHKYTEKIPYDTWRKLVRTVGTIQIEVANNILNIHKWPDSTVLYSTKTYDWGFGRFFYNYMVKKENERKMFKVDLDLNTQYNQYADVSANQIDNGNWDPVGDAINSATSAIDSATGATITSNGIVWEYGYDDSNSASSNTTTYYPSNLGTISTITSLEDRVNCLEAEIQKKVDKEENNTIKENKKMKGFNFEFGSCSGDNVRMSMYGLAVKNSAGSWVSFNPNTYNIVDVEIMNFDGGKYLYKMPTAIRDIQVGDVIIHCRKPMFVSGINEKSLIAIDPVDGEVKEIMPTVSPFGFNFVTKIVNLFASYMTAPTADQPFGNMLPFMLMSGESGKDIDPMMLMLMMNQNGNGRMSNLMPMCLMMKDRKDIDPLMLMALSDSFNSAPAHPHVCHCGKHAEQEAEPNN
jgi:hypothetical protein